MKTDSHYYHCASKGLEDSLLFYSREHYIAGMNRVGFCHLKVPEVIIIAFVLMDNHVHFILHGTDEDCKRFMACYKKLTGYYLATKHDTRLLDFEYGCWLIPNKEKLMEKICYVLRNPMAAGINILPTNYLWGSGTLLFNDNQTESLFHTIGGTTEYFRRKIFGTKLEIPNDWLINDEGMIWPGSYVDGSRAEYVFGSMVNFMFELNKKNEDLVNREMYGREISLNDNDLLSIIRKESEDTFGESDISLLTVDQRLELIRSIRKTYGSDKKQLGRLFHLKQQDLKKVL